MDLKTYCIDALKNENKEIDTEFVEKFVFSFTSNDPFPIPIETLVEWKVDCQKSGAIRRIKQNFVKDQDFKVTLLKSTGGRPAKQIMLSVECFKSLCAQAQNEIGKKTRDFYFALERLWMLYMTEQFKTPEEKHQQEPERKDEIWTRNTELHAMTWRQKSIKSELGTIKAGFYIISDFEQHTCMEHNCSRPVQYMIGIDLVNVADKIDAYWAKLPYLKIDYLCYLQASHCELLETSILNRYEKNRFSGPGNRWIFNIPLNDIIQAVEHIIEYMRMKHEPEPRIREHNEHIKYLLSLRGKKIRRF